MGYISEEVLATKVSCTILNDSEAIEYRKKMEATFGTKRWPLWENIENAVFKQDADAWRWMREFLSEAPGYLFFNPDNDKDILRFENAKSIVDAIADSFLFEFYVSDANNTFFLCFNHHDVLIAAGTAREWLENRVATENKKMEKDS